MLNIVQILRIVHVSAAWPLRPPDQPAGERASLRRSSWAFCSAVPRDRSRGPTQEHSRRPADPHRHGDHDCDELTHGEFRAGRGSAEGRISAKISPRQSQEGRSGTEPAPRLQISSLQPTWRRFPTCVGLMLAPMRGPRVGPTTPAPHACLPASPARTACDRNKNRFDPKNFALRPPSGR